MTLAPITCSSPHTHAVRCVWWARIHLPATANLAAEQFACPGVVDPTGRQPKAPQQQEEAATAAHTALQQLQADPKGSCTAASFKCCSGKACCCPFAPQSASCYNPLNRL